MDEINIINAHKAKVMTILSGHIGKEKAIGMGELYELAFGEAWQHRINDTRQLRTIITLLRKDGAVICSTPATHGGGYYLASAGSELEDYLGKRRRKAITILWEEARIRRIGLAELLGQMQMNLTA